MDLKTLEEVELLIGSIDENYIAPDRCEGIDDVLRFIVESIQELKKGAL